MSDTEDNQDTPSVPGWNNEIGVEVFDNEVTETKKKRIKSGGFQGMGLNDAVIQGIKKRGYEVPTPIQRKTIPVALEGRDIVAMARTGSGKTAGFLVPMFEKLKEHNGNGIRALILSPTRELAQQTSRFIKELGKFLNLKYITILGGDPMEHQFSRIHSNPDIVVATPGRFLHLCVEMQLKLNTVEYVVFDEADRLFEMGLSEQLNEIIARLPETRQTLLFSATLPKVLVQFAKAGLCDPVLIRLDVESKIPDTLELNFFYCRPEERDAALLCLLKQIVKQDALTIIFAATKHHVEYIHSMLDHEKISNTYIYSDLDPAARKIHSAKFQNSLSKVLIVTDVAARGIDIPKLDYVINYNFPAKPKLFVHRVGRCARAGRSGHALSLVTSEELCFLIDLQLFLGRPLTMVQEGVYIDTSKDMYFGKIPQSLIEDELNALNLWSSNSADVEPMKKTCENGYKSYTKSRPPASKDSVRRAKEVNLQKMHMHPMFWKFENEVERYEFISKMRTYKPKTTVFEIGQSSNSIMNLQTRLFRKINKQNIELFHKKQKELKNKEILCNPDSVERKLECSDANDIKEAFEEIITHRKRKRSCQANRDDDKKEKRAKIDTENFIPYYPTDKHSEAGLAINDLGAKSSEAVLDLMGDSNDMLRSQKKIERKWDPIKHKYVAENNKEKKIKSESGQWIPVSYKTDKYKKWQEKNKITNMEGNSDDESGAASSAPKPVMRLDTQWARHNAKIYMKEQREKKPDTAHILKQRKIKEKRRLRNGKKSKRKGGKK